MNDLRLWEESLFEAVHQLHNGRNRWAIWNEVEDFFMCWIRDVNDFM